MKTCVKQFLFTTILFTFISCGQRQKIDPSVVKVDNTYEPTYTVDQLTDKLELSYKQAQPDSLRQIFINWNKTVKPNSDDFIRQNKTINALFDVYKEFYKPFNLLKLGDWEWGNKLNSECEYVVVQKKYYIL